MAERRDGHAIPLRAGVVRSCDTRVDTSSRDLVMRWVAGLVFLLGLYLGAAHFSGGAFPTLGLPIGGDRALLRQTTDAFIEDIKFKDFKKAASYHAPDKRDAVDIPFLIERLFVQKPESLDIMSYEIMMSEIDSTNSVDALSRTLRSRT